MGLCYYFNVIDESFYYFGGRIFMTLFEELKRRGLLAQLTDEDEIKNALEIAKMVGFYFLTVYIIDKKIEIQ